MTSHVCVCIETCMVNNKLCPAFYWLESTGLEFLAAGLQAEKYIVSVVGDCWNGKKSDNFYDTERSQHFKSLLYQTRHLKACSIHGAT